MEGEERRGTAAEHSQLGEVRGSLTKSPHQLWDISQGFSTLTQFQVRQYLPQRLHVPTLMKGGR